MKDEEQLKIDLWCHFGKVFVHNVDQGILHSSFCFVSEHLLRTKYNIN